MPGRGSGWSIWVDAVDHAARYKRYQIDGKRHRDDTEGTYGGRAKLNSHGEIQMHKISLFAVAAVVIATGLGAWAASTTNARVAPPMGQGIEPFQLMMNAKELPATEFADYTFVFR
jgi:hypothetical protein